MNKQIYNRVLWLCSFILLMIVQPGLQSAYGQLSTRKTVTRLDEDKFAVQWMFDALNHWSQDSPSADELQRRLQMYRADYLALKAAARIRHADENLVKSLDCINKQVTLSTSFFARVNSIRASDRVARNEDVAGTTYKAFKVGADSRAFAKDMGFENEDSNGIGLLAGIIGAGYEAEKRKKERDLELKSNLDLAVQNFKQQTKYHSELFEGYLEKFLANHQWTQTSLGIGKFKPESWKQIKNAQPDNLFTHVRFAKLNSNEQNQSQIMYDAEKALGAYLSLPRSGNYSRFRERYLKVAAGRATTAALYGVKNYCQAESDSTFAKDALRIVEKYRDMPESDDSFTNAQLARLFGVSHDYKLAIKCCQKVASKDRDASFWLRYSKLLSLGEQVDPSFQALKNAFTLGIPFVKHVRTSPDLRLLRQKKRSEFNDLTKVKYSWEIQWGYRIADDKIILRNKSAFPLTGVELQPIISSSNYSDWSKTLTAKSVGAGESLTWNLGVMGITSRGDDWRGKATLTSDQY